jgi:hypothetical protein
MTLSLVQTSEHAYPPVFNLGGDPILEAQQAGLMNLQEFNEWKTRTAPYRNGELGEYEPSFEVAPRSGESSSYESNSRGEAVNVEASWWITPVARVQSTETPVATPEPHPAATILESNQVMKSRRTTFSTLRERFATPAKRVVAGLGAAAYVAMCDQAIQHGTSAFHEVPGRATVKTIVPKLVETFSRMPKMDEAIAGGVGLVAGIAVAGAGKYLKNRAKSSRSEQFRPSYNRHAHRANSLTDDLMNLGAPKQPLAASFAQQSS